MTPSGQPPTGQHEKGKDRAEFPPREYQRRLKALQERMEHGELDAMLVADERNYRYVTGHHSELWKNPARPMVCWIPRRGEPLLVASEHLAGASARQTAWCPKRFYHGPTVVRGDLSGTSTISFEPDAGAAIIDAARELGIDRAKRVGLPMGGHSRVDVSLSTLQVVQEALPGVSWVDGSEVLWLVRMVKSPLEIEYMRRSAHALDAAFQGVVPQLRPGMTEHDVERALRQASIAAGADHGAYTHTLADVDRAADGDAPGVLIEGTTILMDHGATVHGYWSDFNRNAFLGTPTQRHRDAQRQMAEALAVGIDAMRPGNTAADVARLMAQSLSESSATPGHVGRLGHGIGLEMVDPPSLHLDDDTVLQPGMVVCVEPNARFPGVGVMVVEDMVVVTEEGPQVLSSVPTSVELLGTD